MSSDNGERILTIVRQIPRGCVASYGQIAKLAGIPRNSRQVGYVLKTLKEGSDVPWYRVVNSKGEISSRHSPDSMMFQRELLEAEGVEVDQKRGRVSLKDFGWDP